MYDMLGCKFGRWEVMEFIGKSHNSNDMWLCKCECGTTRNIAGYRLRKGRTNSCGCLSAELASVRNGTHRMSKSTEYRTWCGMMARCYNPNNHAYKDYGGRGIGVTKRWHTFENFFEDMGKHPKGLELDRIENDDWYSPKNCRWATRVENNRNRRNTVYLTAYGKTLSLPDWANIMGVNYKILWERLKYGWTHEEIVTRPIRKVSPPDAYLK